jgi:S1-C subfamily serine protease
MARGYGIGDAKMHRAVAFALALSYFSASACAEPRNVNVIELSREASVKIVSVSGNSSGTGFLVADQYVLTCFHVAAAISVNGNNVNYTIYPDLQVTLSTGETMGAAVITVPTAASPEPLQYDFAVLKLQRQPSKSLRTLTLSSSAGLPTVGDEVIFSGFPLATPGMVTHRGMVSGHDDAQTLIFVEASINKGNSGGALLDQQGEVLGILSNREGGISQGLDQARKMIDQATKSGGSVKMFGVDPLETDRMLINTLDAYISTGIGYARNIRFAREYIASNKMLTK